MPLQGLRMPVEAPLTDLSGELLRARLAFAVLYQIYSEAAPATAAEGTPQREAYFDALERQGRLFGHGPLEAVDGCAEVELSIVAAASSDEAALIAGSDPHHQKPGSSHRIQPHVINEGVACYLARAMARRPRRPWNPREDLNGARAAADGLSGPAALVQLVYLEPTDKPRPSSDTQTNDAHFVWLRHNEMDAKLISCGPVASPAPLEPGIWGGGMGILATSKSEAAEIAATEPSGRAGYRTLRLRGWTLRRGLAAPIARSLLALNQAVH